MEEVRQDLSPLLTAFPRQRQHLLPALQRVQDELAWLPLWALEAVGQHLRVPKSEVYGVATHYPEFRLEPVTPHVVAVCTGLSCRVTGAGEIVAALERLLGIQSGETSADGRVLLKETSCAFICGVAPVIELNGVALGRLSANEVDGLAWEVLVG